MQVRHFAFVVTSAMAVSMCGAATVEWRGITWDNAGREFGFLGVEGDKLVLGRNMGQEWWEPGIAHYETSAAFREAGEVSVSVTFVDAGESVVHYASLYQFESRFAGVDMGAFSDWFHRPQAWLFDGIGLNVPGDPYILVGQRTGGTKHTFKTVKGRDRVARFFFDGEKVGEMAAPRWDSIEHVYLNGLDYWGGLTVFLDYRAHVTGDTNGDERVGSSDLNDMLNGFGDRGVRLAGDEDGDGVVDLGDLNRVLNHYTGGVEEGLAVVPEVGVGWVAMGVMGCVMGRRRGKWAYGVR